jgi:hypothetical protein
LKLGGPATWLALGMALTTSHLFWLFCTRDPVVIQRFGAGLGVVGALSIAVPYLRNIEGEVASRLPRSGGLFPRSPERAERDRERREAAKPRVRSEVVQERIWGALVVVVGALLNGYGDLLWPLIARLSQGAPC